MEKPHVFLSVPTSGLSALIALNCINHSLPRPQPFRCYPALVFLCPLPLHFLFISLSFALSFHYHSSCCFLITLTSLLSLSRASLFRSPTSLLIRSPSFFLS